MERLTNIFSKRLLALRTERNVNQQDLADAIGITRQSLSRYELGERVANIETLFQIAKYFNVTADYLLGLTDVASYDADMQAIWNQTGLDEKAVKSITDFHNELKEKENSKNVQDIYNRFMTRTSDLDVQANIDPNTEASPCEQIVYLLEEIVDADKRYQRFLEYLISNDLPTDDAEPIRDESRLIVDFATYRLSKFVENLPQYFIKKEYEDNG